MPVPPRLTKLRAAMADKELDAFLVSSPENREYLSGFTGTAGYLLISQHEALLATDFRYVEQAERQAPEFRVCRIEGRNWLSTLIHELSPRRIGFEGQRLTVIQYMQFKETIHANGNSTHPELVATSGLIESLRAVKEPAELKLIQEAIKVSDAAFNNVSATIRPGHTERQIAWELEKTMREMGADGASFDIIVGAGSNSAMPHHHPTDRPVQEGEPIVIDMGAKYAGYCSDLTRTIVLGHSDDVFRRIFDIVLAAQEIAIATVEAQMTGNEADALARQVIQQAGYSKNFGHGLGHGVGLEIHEYPGLGPQSTDTLENGMVFTIEPGIYLSGWGGVRIEDIVVLENGKAKTISEAYKLEKHGN